MGVIVDDGMTLEDIITSNRKEQKEKKKLNKPLAKKVPRQDKPRSVTSTADRLTVSNLGPNVTQQDVKELFARIGPVKVATLSYNAEGKSRGDATIQFVKQGDAHKAFTEYHNRPLDDRPMKINLLINPETVKDIPIQSRLGGAGKTGGVTKKGKKPRPKRAPKKDVTAMDLDTEMESYMNESAPAQNLADALS